MGGLMGGKHHHHATENSPGNPWLGLLAELNKQSVQGRHGFSIDPSDPLDPRIHQNPDNAARLSELGISPTATYRDQGFANTPDSLDPLGIQHSTPANDAALRRMGITPGTLLQDRGFSQDPFDTNDPRNSLGRMAMILALLGPNGSTRGH